MSDRYVSTLDKLISHVYVIPLRANLSRCTGLQRCMKYCYIFYALINIFLIHGIAMWKINVNYVDLQSTLGGVYFSNAYRK
jgi:thiosulfate reductase cytochrome b subunit